jgi:hypothetical protein
MQLSIQKAIPSSNENVPLEYAGLVHHPEETLWNWHERIIAGNRIPDSQRKAWNRLYEADENKHLQPIKFGISGSLGFVDFKEENSLQNIIKCDAIYVTFLGVEPGKRFNGTGKSLMEGVERVGRMRSAKKVYGYIFSSRDSDPTDFFEKIGYEINKNNFSKYL